MSAANATIQLDPQTAEVLARYAAVLGLTVSDFLKQHFVGGNGAATVVDVDRWLDELADGTDALPPLPRDFSSHDIYADHD